MSNVNSALMWP